MKHIYSLAVLLLFSLSVSAQTGKQLIILQTSDTHSRIEPVSPDAADTYAGMGGVIRRTSFIKEMRAKHPDILLFDCGDISQGTPYYNLFQGEVEVKMMNLMKYDAMTIGNHEFDFGLDNMARLFRMAEFPIVCSNYDVKGTVLEGLVKPYIILERNGLKIGVFGLAPQLEGLVQADKCEGIVYNDPVEVAQKTADYLKLEEGCDAVICLSHLGIRGSGDACDENLASKTRNIDAILGGHSHTFMQKPVNYLNADGKDVPVFHTGKNGVYVGELTLTLTKK
ncbi:bifunctional UDP-sugar hydrolase/5'-nucleotidase [Bacteroides helcogenes]|uniref:Metallophosphoesterase n=1 Tax=Bacteroides helcogenes (strain ATCC 35417 / DSM 20613 / JCM 6297 / CCUG 15421 / P 36-108) TaxID=693979 RepID=E6STS3_BACT6|nr:metallophosphatase [Bacteroides helcogenes]ADV42276.1 metallophosphoesterase [Bacteroides helcogenes P 36-108]MDY5237270.1 metallophosphatase [Bacteroides helcogenes]